MPSFLICCRRVRGIKRIVKHSNVFQSVTFNVLWRSSSLKQASSPELRLYKWYKWSNCLAWLRLSPTSSNFYLRFSRQTHFWTKKPPHHSSFSGLIKHSQTCNRSHPTKFCSLRTLQTQTHPAALSIWWNAFKSLAVRSHLRSREMASEDLEAKVWNFSPSFSKLSTVSSVLIQQNKVNESGEPACSLEIYYHSFL